MDRNSIRHAKKLAAIAWALAMCGPAWLSRADIFSANASDNATIQPGGPRSGSNGKLFFNVEDGSNGVNASFGVIDFSAANFSLGNNLVTSVNSITLDLFNAPAAFSATSPIDLDFFLTNDTGVNIQPGTSPLLYQTNQTPDGVGNQLNTLFPLGVGFYANTGAATASNFDYTYNLTLSADAQAYLINQLNNFGTLRLVVTANGPNDDGAKGATFSGIGNASTSPEKLSLDLGTTSLGANDSSLQINLGGGTLTKTPQTIVFDRVYKNSTALPAALTLVNNGSTATVYTISAQASNANNNIAGGLTQIGTEPLAGGASTTINVGIAPGNIQAGIPTALGTPVTNTITIQNQRNATDGSVTVVLQANAVVTDRFVDSAGSDQNSSHTGQGWDFGRILIGKGSVTTSVTVDTENDTSGTTGPLTRDSSSLTEVRLLASTTLTPTGTTGNSNSGRAQVTMAAGAADQDFIDGTESATRTVTFKPLSGSGGAYSADGVNYDFISYPLTNIDSAIGLGAIGSVVSTSDWGRINLGGTLYQQAALSTTSSTATTLVLFNAKHTVNNVTPIGATSSTDIGLRVAAQITGTSMAAQDGFTVSGFSIGTTIADNTSTSGAVTFAPAGKLNGNYSGTFTVQSQTADQTIVGAAPNDIAPVNFNLNATVSGNTGSGAAGLLAGKAFGGYNISRGAGHNTRFDSLAGTMSSNGTLTVAWGDGTAGSLSDQATVNVGGIGLHAVQLSYDPTALTDPTQGVPTLAWNGTSGFVNAALGNSTGGSATLVIGAYDNTLAADRFGIDPNAHSVWAVLAGATNGQFQAMQRSIGDSDGDGLSDLATLNIVSNTDYTAGGNISGNMAIIKSGNSLLGLAGNLTTGAPVTISAGTLLLSGTTNSVTTISGAGTLQVSAGSHLTSGSVQLDTLIVNGSQSLLPLGTNSGFSRVNTLTIAHTGSGTSANYTGVIDIADNPLIVETNSSNKALTISGLVDAVRSGSNGATWTGNGITSSTAQLDSAQLGVGIFDNGVLGKTSFGGQALDSNSILTAVAHLGDANRDGVVDLQDLSIITNNWQQSRDNWAQGDLNGDGVVDLGDLSLVTNNWQQTSSFSQVVSPIGPPSGIGSVAVNAVPEPASLGLLSLGVLLIGRRGRYNRGSSGVRGIN